MGQLGSSSAGSPGLIQVAARRLVGWKVQDGFLHVPGNWCWLLAKVSQFSSPWPFIPRYVGPSPLHIILRPVLWEGEGKSYKPREAWAPQFSHHCCHIVLLRASHKASPGPRGWRHRLHLRMEDVAKSHFKGECILGREDALAIERSIARSSVLFCIPNAYQCSWHRRDMINSCWMVLAGCLRFRDERQIVKHDKKSIHWVYSCFL